MTVHQQRLRVSIITKDGAPGWTTRKRERRRRVGGTCSPVPLSSFLLILVLSSRTPSASALPTDFLLALAFLSLSPFSHLSPPRPAASSFPFFPTEPLCAPRLKGRKRERNGGRGGICRALALPGAAQRGAWPRAMLPRGRRGEGLNRGARGEKPTPETGRAASELGPKEEREADASEA